jgi:outer membrane lipoprotein SlyB
MKKLIALAMIALVATTFIGCAAMPVVSGPVQASGQKVEAQAKNMNILMFITPMSLETAQGATQELAKKCGGKEVVGVTSHWHTMPLYVLTFETLSVSGYCKE